MESSGTQTPAGWYSDPTGDGLRYWDGAAWTEHTHAAPTPAAATQPAGEQGAGAATGTGVGAQRSSAEVAASGSPAQQPQSGGGPPPGQASAAAPRAGAAGPAATTSPAAAKRGPSNGEWALSVLLAVIPVLGLIWGVYLIRAKDGREAAGNVAIVLSLAVILLIILAVQL
jgi:hypothetical protein